MKRYTERDIPYDNIKMFDALDIVNKIHKLVIVGKPGSGKTTFLKYLVIKSVAPNSGLKEERLPIHASLKKFSDGNSTLFEFICAQFDICDFEDSTPKIKKMLELGKFRILLDGLDEVKRSEEDRILNEVSDFSKKFSKNQFIITCRTAAYRRHSQCLEDFKDVEISGFSDDQIRVFIDNWFKDDLATANHLINSLNKQSGLKELCQIPLILALTSLMYSVNYELPTNKGEIYSKAIDELLSKWDGRRRIQRGNLILENLSTRQKLDFFEYLAAKSFQDEEYFLTERQLQSLMSSKVRNYLKNNLEEVTAVDVARAIEENYGLIIEREADLFSFSHLTIQEYFTAQYIINNANSGSLTNLTNYIFDSRWREVFSILSSICPANIAEELLSKIVEKLEHQITLNTSLSTFLSLSENQLYLELAVHFREVINPFEYRDRSDKHVSDYEIHRFNSFIYNSILFDSKKIRSDIKEYSKIDLLLKSIDTKHIFKYIKPTDLQAYKDYMWGLSVFFECLNHSLSLLNNKFIANFAQRLIKT